MQTFRSSTNHRISSKAGYRKEKSQSSFTLLTLSALLPLLALFVLLPLLALSTLLPFCRAFAFVSAVCTVAFGCALAFVSAVCAVAFVSAVGSASSYSLCRRHAHVQSCVQTGNPTLFRPYFVHTYMHIYIGYIYVCLWIFC